MAVFETKSAAFGGLDDTIPLECIFETARSLKGHVEYFIRVQRGPVPEQSWQLSKRYSDFSNLDTYLRTIGLDFSLPPKKVFGNMDRDFIVERQTGLQNYMNRILSSNYLASSIALKQFLDPKNYTANYREIALAYVSMLFRSEPKWEIVENLPELGWRMRKHYIHIKPIHQSNVHQLLSWAEFGPIKIIPDKELSAILRLRPSIQHPNLYPIHFAVCMENAGITISYYNERGSLRDYLCRCKPKGHYLKKYAVQRPNTGGLKMEEIKVFGKQILDTVKYLHDKGIPYCHLHPGNIIIESNQCRLTETENWLLGLPSVYRGYFTQFRKISTTELIDVYCFGQTFYEMVFGQPLDQASCDQFPQECPAEIRSVLESILTSEACKRGLPSISDLRLHPLFSDIHIPPPSSKPSFKLPSKLKEAVKAAKVQFEEHLQAQQKVISQYRRLSKAKAFHMSTDEKSKRIKIKKKALENGVAEPVTPTSPEPTTPVTPMTPTTPTSPGLAPPPPPPPPAGGAPAAPPPPPMPLAAPALPQQVSVTSSGSSDRGALLSSISGFSKGKLKKTGTVDKSSPVL